MQAKADSPNTLVSTDAALAKLTETRDRLAGIVETLARMDHAQDALLENGHSLQGQMETITGLLSHVIEVLTPERPEQEGPTLKDFLSRLITQQAALADLMKHTLETVTRIERGLAMQGSLAGTGRG